MSNYFDNKELFLEPKVKQYGSHMVMSNVYKNTKIKYVNIDTKFRDEYNYNDTVNYTLTLPERITDVKKLKVKSIELPITFYNISAALGNNCFKISDGTYSAIITLPDGNYTESTLLSELNSLITDDSIVTKLELQGLTFTITNNKINVYANGANDVTIGYQITIDFAIDQYGNFDKYNFKSKLGWLLGFRDTTYDVIFTYDDEPTVTDLTGPDGQSRVFAESLVDLNGCKTLYLAIDEFSKSNPNSFVTLLSSSLINKTIISRISLDKAIFGFGSVMPANLYNGLLITDERTYSGKIDIQKLNIQLLNEFGKSISLNGMDFSLCLEIEHE
jgi:hypothetical protein